MDKVVMLDEEGLRVTVEPGCTWQRIREVLSSENLSLRSYPSNTTGGTVGGWLSSGGYGVGTLSGGRFDTILDSLEAAVPSGLLVTAGHGGGRYSIESFARTEGQMGIVTSLTFPLKRKPDLRAHYIIGPVALEAAQQGLRDLAGLDNPPFGLRLLAGGFPRILGPARSTAEDGLLLVALFEGSETDAVRFEKRANEVSGRLCTEVRGGETARRVFETQFTEFAEDGVKTVVRSGEVLVGIDRLEGFLKPLVSESGGDLVLDCQVVGRDLVLVMACYIMDGRGLPPVIRDVPLTVRISLAALRCGGRPYGLGIWNSPFSKRVLGGEWKGLRAIKNDTDRLKILNPGKYFSLITAGGLPVWGLPYRIGLRMIGAFGEGGVR
jgi:glycolate oxidase